MPIRSVLMGRDQVGVSGVFTPRRRRGKMQTKFLVSDFSAFLWLCCSELCLSGIGMLTGEERNVSESRQGRRIGGMSVGGLRSLGRNLKSDLKEGREDLEDLLHTTLSDEENSSNNGNTRSSPSSLSKQSDIDMEYLPQIPLGPHVNLSAFGAKGVSGSQYQSIKQVLTPIQTLVSFFGGGDVMCGIFPSTCPSRLPRRKRSPSLLGGGDVMCRTSPHTCPPRLSRRKRSPRKRKNGGSKKPSSSGRKVRVKNLPHLISSGGKFFSGSINGAKTILGMVNGQQDRRMYQQYGRLPYRPHPSPSQLSPDYDH